jgi:hypothetical protein
MAFLKPITAALLGLPLCFAAAHAGGGLKGDFGAEPAPARERGEFFTGVDLARGSQYYFDGIEVALNGDYSKDGFVLRFYGSYQEYDLRPGDGSGWEGDIMVGYKFSRNLYDATFYIGADYQNYRVKPEDPFERPLGTEWGFKVAGYLETNKDLPYYASLAGNYSTAFDSYWVRGRVGVNRQHGLFGNTVTFGPEGIAMGDVGFDAQRVGAFITFDVNLLPGRAPFELTLSSGYQFVDSRRTNGVTETAGPAGGEGAYGTIVISTTF